MDRKENLATLVMEYFEGQSLSNMIKNNVIHDEKTILNIMKQLMDTLVYLHEQNIIHRDISLENILYNQKTE